MSDDRVSMSPVAVEVIRRQVQRIDNVLNHEGWEFGEMSDAALEVHQALNQLITAHNSAEVMEEFNKEQAADDFLKDLGVEMFIPVEEVYLNFWARKDRPRRAAVHMITHSSYFRTLEPFLIKEESMGDASLTLEEALPDDLDTGALLVAEAVRHLAGVGATRTLADTLQGLNTVHTSVFREASFMLTQP